MHVVDHNQFMSYEQHVLTRAQESGDDARDPAAMADHRARRLSHEPEACSAIDETDVLIGNDAAKIARGLGEGFVPAGAWPAIDADIPKVSCFLHGTHVPLASLKRQGSLHR